MNDSSNIPSARGVLYHGGGGGGPDESAHYPGQLQRVQIPRSIGEQPLLAIDGYPDVYGAVALANRYRGLASRGSYDGSGQSSSYVPGNEDSRIQSPEDNGIGIGQSSSGNANSHGDIANAMNRQQVELQSVSKLPANGSMSPPLNAFQTTSGQERHTVGNVKPLSANMVAPSAPDVDVFARERSGSIGSASHENKIVALSMQLRNRLSYAAARIEKNRQSQEAKSRSPSLQVSVGGSQQIHDSHGDKDSSEGRTVSAPDDPACKPYPPDGPAQSPPLLSSYPNSQTISHNSPRKNPSAPKLAPPVDIISGGQSGRRRRPNPKEWIQPPRCNPSPRHRRHHSQQEFGITKPYNDHRMPGTLALRPSAYPTHTPYNGASKPLTQSQNTSMEQDAIETLLFMSSPENSGYRANMRQRSNTTMSNNIDSFMSNNSSATAGSQNQSYSSHMDCDTGPPAPEWYTQSQHRNNGLEAQAGDEIDRMLDQMNDSDSEDERRAAPTHYRSRTLH